MNRPNNTLNLLFSTNAGRVAIEATDSGIAVTHDPRVNVFVKEDAHGGVVNNGDAAVLNTVSPPAHKGNPVHIDIDGARLEPGYMMEDGTILAGVSPDTGEPFFVPPTEEPDTFTWYAAMKDVASLEVCGHKDWRLPTKNELDVLFANRDLGCLRGSFNEKATTWGGPAWHWSSTEHPIPGSAWNKGFHDGSGAWAFKFFDAAVRPVRSGPVGAPPAFKG